MPAYNSSNFRPPAPVALVTFRSPASNATVSNVPMLLDTGADVSLVPRDSIANIAVFSGAEYELEAYDGARTTAPAVELVMQFLGKTFRGQFLAAGGDHGVLGRNILNNLSLQLNGPAQTWTETG